MTDELQQKIHRQLTELAVNAGAVLLALAVISIAIILLSTAPVYAADKEKSECTAAIALADLDQQWRFRVFLDEKEIGCHYYFLDERENDRLLQSVADFEYKLLFVKLFDYEHENNETWAGNCLTRIESSTDANGKPFAVKGEIQEEGFLVTGSTGEASLPACIMSFAYWNPEFLRATHLLNTQTGEYIEVSFEDPVGEVIDVSGEQWQSWRYRLSAGELIMDLWYSEAGQWLALRTEARAGRMLRYERMPELTGPVS